MINRRLFGILAALPAALGPLDTRAQTEVPDSTLPETARELGPSSTASEKDPAPTAPAPAPGQFMVRLEGGDPRVPAELLIDGWSVGLLPWSGSLPPGARTFAVRWTPAVVWQSTARCPYLRRAPG